MPNSDASPDGIDFVTALARLLQSGTLRDEFVANAAGVSRRLGVRPSDREMFLQLAPVELEAQAVVLLRKRFDLVRRWLARTCRSLGNEAWPMFQAYSRTTWPQAKSHAANDAKGFCAMIDANRPAALCRIEFHRVHFLCGENRWSVCFLHAVPVRPGFRPGLQIFLRHRRGRWHEWVIFAGA